MGYWARVPQARGQQVLISTTLDDVIPPDHPVRLVADLLDGFDWTSWESQFHGFRGKPPIHPRVLAGLWLYGLRRGVRSSRKLEYMSRHSVDFLWLAEGHTPDHSTLSQFRHQHGDQLKGLFRHVLRVAMAAGLLRLIDVGTDGTRVKANNGRYETWTAETIAAVIDDMLKEFETKLAQTRENDRRDEDLLGGPSAERLPPELADLKLRREKLEQIQRDLKELDEARRKQGTKTAAQIPKHDPDSRVLPNKEGGYAPNYTPICTAEGHGGFIVDLDVIAGVTEQRELLPSLDRIEEMLGEKPENALADGLFATGSNIEGTQQRGIEFFSNLPSPDPATNPAIRADPTQPVPPEQWDQLPINATTKKLDKSCFQYDSTADVYYCPQGHAMSFEVTNSETKNGEKSTWDIYRCGACHDCPLKSRCTAFTNKGGRTAHRDKHTTQREEMGAKMRGDTAKKKYDQRMRIAETPFAMIKHVLGLRQFLLRGLDKVKVEWLWIGTAINLDKLARGMARLRNDLEMKTLS